MARLIGFLPLLIPLLFTSVAAKIGYFWHITDIHYDVNYTMDGDSRRMCWRTDSGGGGGGVNSRRPAGRFGDYSCDSPWGLVESAARAMKSKHGDNIEFVLWTGDDIAHVKDDYLSTEKVLMVMQNLTDLLRHTFSSQFVFPVLGNHDFYPQNQLPPRRHPTYKRVAEMWRYWLPTEAIDSFEKGGYYTIEQKGSKFRIVALNTNLYYRANQLTSGNGGIGSGVGGRRGERRGSGNWPSGTSSGGAAEGIRTGEEASSAETDPQEEEGEEDDPAGQWKWLEGVLEKSLSNGETVYLVGHVPPGVDERSTSPTAKGAFQQRFNERYLNLVRKYSQVIVGQFFGHYHSDTFRVIYNEREQPISWIFLAPSVTPWRTPGGANNPGLRLYKFETTTGQVLDYTQYYLDLSTANHLDNAEWRLEYNFTTFYGLPNISAASLHELAETFQSKTPPVEESTTVQAPASGDQTANVQASGSPALTLPVVSPMLGADLFERYYRANSVSYHSGGRWGACDATCRRGHYCSITKVDYAEFQECVEAVVEEIIPSAIDNSASVASYSLLVAILHLARWMA